MNSIIAGIRKTIIFFCDWSPVDGVSQLCRAIVTAIKIGSTFRPPIAEKASGKSRSGSERSEIHRKPE